MTINLPSRLHVELVTPSKLFLDCQALMVSLPGGNGYYCVLPGHIPIMTTMQSGIINIYQDSIDAKPSHRIFVSGGYVDAEQSRCTIIADDAFDLNAITSQDALLSQLDNLKRTEASEIDEGAREVINKQIDSITALLEVINSEGKQPESSHRK